MEWYKCRPRKLLDACEGLGTAALVSTYRTVIDRIYECDGPISSDAASIGRYAGLRPSHAAKAISELIELGKLFVTDDGKLFNRFANGELGDRAAISEKRAAAGSKGGQSRGKGGANGDQSGRNGGQSGNNAQRHDQQTAENGQSGQANASTRARDKRREEREDPPTPQKGKVDLDGQKPAPDPPLSDAERAAMAREVAGVADRPDLDDGAVARLTGEIMRRAKMTAPPIDLVLAESWLSKGISEELILECVTRLAGGAKGPVRFFRYFDAEIRRQHEAKASAEDADVADFRRIAARSGGS